MGSNPYCTLIMPLWTNWLSRNPFKVESSGSSPDGGTNRAIY